jgi:hypothetical protein
MYKYLDIILNGEQPKFINHIIYDNSYPVIIEWLKKWIKKDLSCSDIEKFICQKNTFHIKYEDYKSTLHYLILKDILKLDLEEEMYYFTLSTSFDNIDKTKRKQFQRKVKICLIDLDI